MAKVITLKPGTTLVCRRASDGKNLELVVHSEREAADQHLDAHTLESGFVPNYVQENSRKA